MALFGDRGSRLSDYFDRWGAEIEMQEREKRRQRLLQLEYTLDLNFKAAEAGWEGVESRFKQILHFVPEDRMPEELEGFSAKGESLLAKTILYFESLALGQVNNVIFSAGEMVGGAQVNCAAALFRALREAHPKLLDKGARLADAPFYREVGVLNDEECGTFWQACIRAEAARREWEEKEYGEYEEGVLSYDIQLGLANLLEIRNELRGDEEWDVDAFDGKEVLGMLSAFEAHVRRELG